MNPFSPRRTLPDGRKAAGPLVYLIIALVILGLFVYYNIRSGGGSTQLAPIEREVDADVSRVNRAISNFESVNTPTPAPGPVARDNTSILEDLERYDTEPVNPSPTPNEVDQITLDDSPQRNQTPPPSQPVETPTFEVDNLVAYTAPSPSPSPVPTAAPTAVPSGFTTNNFLPRGALIPVYFLSTVKTGSLEDLVVLGVAENVVFNHKVQLPFGTRLLGSAGAAGDGDRIAINVDTVLFPNGEELPISGLGKDIDRGPGVRGYYIPQPLWVQILPYVNNFIAAYLDTLQQTVEANIVYTIPGGGTVSQQQNVADLSDPRTALVTSASAALRDATVQTMETLNQLYKPYLIIPPGTAAFVQLRQATDITRAKVNGSAENPMPILPGFQNNPIPPSGLNEPGDNTSGGTVQAGDEFNPNRNVIPQPTPVDPVPDMTNPNFRRGINQTNQQGLPPIPTPAMTIIPPIQPPTP